MLNKNTVFNLGDEVYHRDFGRGVIRGSRRVLNQHKTRDCVQVVFDTAGTKWIIATPEYLHHKPRVLRAYPMQKVSLLAVRFLVFKSIFSKIPRWRPKFIYLRTPQTSVSRRGALKTLFGLAAILPVVTATKAASAKAKRLPALQTRIAGFAHYQGEACKAHIKPGHKLHLRREPKNSHDSKAIEVFWQGHKLGYVPKSHNAALSQLLDGGEQLSASVVVVKPQYWEPLTFIVHLWV